MIKVRTSNSRNAQARARKGQPTFVVAHLKLDVCNLLLAVALVQQLVKCWRFTLLRAQTDVKVNGCACDVLCSC